MTLRRVGADPRKAAAIALLMDGKTPDEVVRRTHLSKSYVLNLRALTMKSGKTKGNVG